MHLRSRLMGILAIGLVATGCSVGQHSGPYDVATAGNKLVLTIYTYGGLAASNYDQWASSESQFSLYGDGRVILNCAAYQMHPDVLPCLDEIHVSPDEIQRIVVAADTAGLLSDASFDDYLWTDDETTVFKTTVGGTTHTVEAYALDPSYPSTDGGVKAARQRLIAFRASMTDLSGFLGRKMDIKPYAATSMRVRAHSAETSSPQAPAPVRTWPLPQARAEGGTGVTLTGVDMATFVGAAAGATVWSVWSAPNGYFQLSAHPLCPNE